MSQPHIQEVTPEMLAAENARLTSIVDVQRQKLAIADDKDTAIQAELIKREGAIGRMNQMIAQVAAENQILRKRLGLGESEPIEVDDETDAKEIAGAVVSDDAPDAQDHVG